MIEQRGITLVGFAVTNLDDDGAVQLALPFDAQAGTALDTALDGVRERFGSDRHHAGRAPRQGRRSGDADAAGLTTASSGCGAQLAFATIVCLLTP